MVNFSGKSLQPYQGVTLSSTITLNEGVWAWVVFGDLANGELIFEQGHADTLPGAMYDMTWAYETEWEWVEDQ